MFCRKKQYLQIQNIHHKALKVVYDSNKNYDELLQDNNEFSIHQRQYGINSVLFRACLLWNSLPQSVKYSESIAELKTKMKNLGNIDCSCILCR